LPAHDFLYDIGPKNGRAREIIVLDDVSGPFGMFVDATHSVVEIAAGDELYMMPPDEESEHSPRVAWGVFTFAERPVMLLDLARTSVH
jgi:chemotaxis signal transduction protein